MPWHSVVAFSKERTVLKESKLLGMESGPKKYDPKGDDGSALFLNAQWLHEGDRTLISHTVEALPTPAYAQAQLTVVVVAKKQRTIIDGNSSAKNVMVCSVSWLTQCENL